MAYENAKTKMDIHLKYTSKVRRIDWCKSSHWSEGLLVFVYLLSRKLHPIFDRSIHSVDLLSERSIFRRLTMHFYTWNCDFGKWIFGIYVKRVVLKAIFQIYTVYLKVIGPDRFKIRNVVINPSCLRFMENESPKIRMCSL